MPAGASHAFQIWKEAGYHIGLIGKNHCFEQPEDLALFDTWCEISHGGLPADPTTKGMAWFRPIERIQAAHTLRRTMTPQNPRFAYATSDFPLEDYSTGLVTGQTIRFLEQHQDEPFALWVSYPDPHEPWVCPQRYADLFPPEKIDLPPQRDDEFAEGTAPERNRVLFEMLGWRQDAIEDVYGLLTAAFKKAMRKRQVWIEPLFGEGKQWHHVAQFRLRGLAKVNIELDTRMVTDERNGTSRPGSATVGSSSPMPYPTATGIVHNSRGRNLDGLIRRGFRLFVRILPTKVNYTPPRRRLCLCVQSLL